MEEVWKDLNDDVLGEYYQVSNLGNIKTKGRWVKNNLAGKIYIDEHLMHPSKYEGNYSRITFQIDKKKYRRKVHRLVAQAFIPNPDMLPVVNHIDGNKQNNQVDNLEWVTHGENNQHAYDTKLRRITKGEELKYSKLKEKDVLEIVELLKTDIKIKEIGNMYGVHADTIRCIKNGKTWMHITGFEPYKKRLSDQ